MDKKIIINFIYNTGYQILTLLLPFITIPYVSRIFSPEELGVYSATLSTAQMFSVIGMFAVGAYGVKEIAANRDDKVKLSEKFYQIRYMQKITMIISIITYYIFFVFTNKGNDKVLYIIQSIHLLAGLVDISWLFIGLEDFKKTVIRNIVVKLGSLTLIFILVNKPTDLWIYTVILAASMLLGNISMWVYIKGMIVKDRKKNKNLKLNITMASSLLIPQIAYQMYTSFDRTILGMVSSMQDVGMYDQSQKIVRMAVGIVTSLGIVMMPRITNMISNNKGKSEINELLRKSLNLTLFISVGCTFGIISISKNFVPWFFGKEYLDVALLLNITSIVCILTALGSFFSNQYAIPRGNKKAYMIPIIIAGILSVAFNAILGRIIGVLGACITIVIVEFLALLLRLFYLRKDLDYRYLFKDLIKMLISGIVMITVVFIMRKVLNLQPNVLSTIIEVISGGSIYIITILLIHKEYRELVRYKFKNKLIRRIGSEKLG